MEPHHRKQNFELAAANAGHEAAQEKLRGGLAADDLSLLSQARNLQRENLVTSVAAAADALARGSDGNPPWI